MAALAAQAANAAATCERCGRRCWCAGARMVCGFCGYEWKSATPEVRIERRVPAAGVGRGDAR